MHDILRSQTFLLEPERVVEPETWLEHIPFAYYLVEALRPRRIVELGAYVGNSYLAFCQAVKLLGLSTRCAAVDTWRGDAHASFYDESVYTSLKAFHDPRYADFSSLMRMTFDEARPEFAEGSIDLLHIDGYHTYAAVRHDFTTWLDAVAEGGIIIMHDVNVWQHDFGAWRQWQEIPDEYPRFSFEHGYGLGVVCKGEPPEAVRWLFEDHETARRTFYALGSRLALEHRLKAGEGTTFVPTMYMDEGADFVALRPMKPLEQDAEGWWRFDTSGAKVLHRLRFDVHNQPAILRLDDIEFRDADGNWRSFARISSNALFLDPPNYHFATPQPEFYVHLEEGEPVPELVRIRWRLLSVGFDAMMKVVTTLRSGDMSLETSLREQVSITDGLRAENAHLRDELTRVSAERQAEAGQLRSEIDRLSPAIGQLQDCTAQLVDARRDAERWRQAHDSLRSSRTWRLARALFSPAYPLARLARKAKHRLEAGSPVFPGGEDSAPERLAGPAPTSLMRAVCVLVPVYNGLDAFKKLTASLQASHPEPEEHLRFIFIDDASPDPAVGIFLAAEDFFVRPDVHVLTNAENLGFTATINRGLAELEEGEDVLILNADTEIHGHVVAILQDVAYRFTDVGSVTPLTNRGTIGALLNWPEGSDDVLGLDPAVVAETVERLRLATPHEPAPTGVGFCMYMTRAALGVAPEFDERAFGKGYGEENDWCQRTIQSGFVHLVTPEAFVFHREKQSFGEDKEALARRNHETLCGLHPGYMPSVRDYIDRDPLARQRAEIVRALRSLTKG